MTSGSFPPVVPRLPLDWGWGEVLSGDLRWNQCVSTLMSVRISQDYRQTPGSHLQTC